MAVGDYNVKPFTLPVEPSPLAYQVRNNDNLLRAKFVEHQDDKVAHIQSGTAANRPSTGSVVGETYIATDTGAVSVWNGTGWVTATGGGGGVTWGNQLINVIWGTPGAEVSNTITVSASSADLDGNTISSSEIGVMVIVTDGAADNEPSETATISAASPAVGTLVAGDGTATAMFKTNASGNFSIKVTETAAASRYVWVRAGGHFQRFVKARDGVLQLTFT